MDVELSPTVRVVSDGLNWALEEFRTWESKGDEKVSKSGWRTVGHYSRLDQACSRALDVCVFDRGLDRVLVTAMTKRIVEAKAEILAAVQAIDPKSLAAAQAKPVAANAEGRAKAAKKHDADMVVKTLTRGKRGK
jgi:hypothetical protein